MNVLIVCAGNTCRSPMAAGLLLRVAQEVAAQVSVRTAGVAHHPKAPVAPEAVAVMSEIGIDISHDYSKPVTFDDLQWADIVVGLQQSHLGYLADQYPWVAPKLHYVGRDIKDPYRCPLEKYRATRDELHIVLRNMAGVLLSG